MSLKLLYDDEKSTIEMITENMSLGTCSVEAFNKSYGEMFDSFGTDKIPVGVRFYSPIEKLLVYETKPAYRSFTFTQDFLHNADNSDNKRTYYIPFPWMQHVVQLSDSYQIVEIYSYFSHKPLPTNSSQLSEHTMYYVPCHNWYDDARLCRPSYSTNPFSHLKPSILSIVTQCEYELWQSGFNKDLWMTAHNYYQKVRDEGSGFHQKSLLRHWPYSNLVETYMSGESDAFASNYYSAWSNVTMDEMLDPDNLCFFNSNFVKADSWITRTTSGGSFSTVKSMLFAAFQNATMMDP